MVVYKYMFLKGIKFNILTIFLQYVYGFVPFFTEFSNKPCFNSKTYYFLDT